MRQKVFYLMRHGEAMCNINLEDKNSDNMLSPLTTNGVLQSTMASEWFKSNNPKIDLIYSSEMKRSQQTAELLKIDKPIVPNKLLNERNFGEAEKIIEKNKLISISKQFNLRPDDYLNWRPDGGESQSDVIKRIKFFLENNNLENSLIVAHGYVIYAIRTTFFQIDKSSDYLNFVSIKGNHVRNCQIYKLIFNPDNKSVKEESYYISNNTWIKLNLA